MRVYEVELKRTSYLIVTVEAESQDEAQTKAFAEATGAAEAIACSSGTTALHLVALGLDIKPGDQAIVPTVTFLATANCVRFCGADVI